MKRPWPPWSWLALALCWLPAGAAMMLGAYVSQSFRRGLDADMYMMYANASALDLLMGASAFGLITLPFVVFGWWVARWTKGGASHFLLATAVIPTSLKAFQTGWYIVGEALAPPSNLIPFESTNLLYLPNWIDLAVVALALLAAGATYLQVARAVKD